jgi:TP901 family phage tail tape measure protein
MIGLGSNSQLGIGIAIKLQDQFSAASQRVNAQLKSLRQNTSSYIDQAARNYRNQAAVVAYGAMQMTRGMYGAAQQGANLVHKLRQIAIVGRDANISYKMAEQLTTQLSQKYAQTLPESSAAIFENVKAGIREGLGLITEYQVAVSKATDETLGGEEGVAKGLISIMNAYQLQSKQFPMIANAVTAAANSSQSSVTSLTEAMKYSGHTFHELNIPLDKSLALLARLSQAGIEGSSAGTALQNAWNQMSKAIGEFSTPKKQKALAMLGLTRKDFLTAQGEYKDIFEIINMVEQKSQGLTGPMRKNLLSEIFNIRGERGIVNLFGTMSDNPQLNIDYFLKEIRKGIQGDIARKQAAEMTDDMASDFQRLRTSVQSLYKTISESPVLRAGVQLATKVINILTQFADSGIGSVITGVVAVLVPLVGIMAAFRAAVITATFALRGMTGGPGFGGLMGGLFGTFQGGPVKRNAAGRTIVRGGQTVNFGGKTYKGGQILPSAYPQMGPSSTFGQGMGSMIGSFFGSGAGASTVASNTGTMARGITGILGTVTRFLPMLGTLGLIVSGVSLLGSLLSEERRQLTPEEIAYRRFIDTKLARDRTTPYGEEEFFRNMGKGSGGSLNINLKADLDGQNVLDKQIQANMEDALMGADINITY